MYHTTGKWKITNIWEYIFLSIVQHIFTQRKDDSMQSKDITDYMNEFIDEADALIDSLVDADWEYVNDWSSMKALREKVFLLKDLHFVYLAFNVLIPEMKNDKDRFEVQKIAKDIFGLYEGRINGLIRICRLWKFKDYRCIDFSKRFVDFLVAIQDALF